MKNIYLLLLATFIFFTADAQLKKGTLIIGGNGSFEFFNYDKEGDPYIKFYEVSASPAVGYLIHKKLAAGLRFTYSGSKQIVEEQNINYKKRDYQYSPFVRYYLLSDKKPYNIIAEVSYDFQVSTYVFNDDQKLRQTGGGYTLSAGPVIFFSPQTALEWSLGYEGGKNGNKIYSIFTSIGFQWHFKKKA